MYRRLLLFAAVSLAGIAGARGEDWQKSFPVTGRPELRVDAKDGAVTVRVWAEKSISAKVYATGWKIAPGELEIIDRQTGDHVELTLRVPSTKWGFGHRGIRMEVNAPRDTRLNLRTGDGAVRVYDVAGEMRINTGDGSIELSGVEGAVEARTGDGRIGVRGKIESLSLHTGDGSIEANLMPGSKPSSGWRVETGDGSVTMRLPSDFAAYLDVHTGDGSVKVDLPVTTDKMDTKNLKGKLNGGGPTLYIRTGDGSVRLAKI